MQMVKKIFAILLFFYAAWQIFTAFSASRQGQGFAQIFWALGNSGRSISFKKAKQK
jgi:hypothetical protein